MKVLAILYVGGEHAEEEPRMLGTVENALGIGSWLKEQGHEFVVVSDKEGPQSDFQKHIVDTDILITTPFHPGYATREIIEKAPKLKACITAGVGSDHIDLAAANEKKILVAEVTGSNVVSVAEHVLMTILLLVRNYTPAHEQIISGGWNVAQVAKNTFDLEGKVVGTLGAGRIGYRVLERLVPFDCAELLYYDYQPLPKEAEAKVGAKRVEDLKEFLGKLDVLTINAPLHEGTKGLINKEKLGWMKKGAWIVNTARGAICNAQDVADAVNSGQIRGYGGDVWPQQPAPEDAPWRKMQYKGDQTKGGNGMTPHVSGTSIDAQIRYANGTKDILKRFFAGEAQEDANIIAIDGAMFSRAYGQKK